MEHVNGWCFRGIYKGGLWENDLHVSAQWLHQSFLVPVLSSEFFLYTDKYRQNQNDITEIENK